MKTIMWSAFFLSLLCIASAQHEAEAEAAVGAGLRWLVEHRSEQGGWGADTAKAVLAISLVNDSALVGVERMLTLKELEVNLLAELWRHRDYPVTTARLAEYVLALVSLCADVQHFQGRDLTAVLQHHRTGPEYESAFAVLATCAARAPVRRRSYERLLAVADSSADLHGTDTLALVVLALRCVADHSSQHVEKHMQEPLMALLQRQQPDGGFGNLFSTLLAMQALRSEVVSGWNESSAVGYLLDRRQQDGSLGSVFDTAGALTVLAGRSLMEVAQTGCHHVTPTPAAPAAASTDTTPTPPPPAVTEKGVDEEGGKVKDDPQEKKEAADTAAIEAVAELAKNSAVTTEAFAPVNISVAPSSEHHPNLSLNIVTLWLWVGADVGEKHSIRLEVPANTSLFECMQLAAERDPHFRFSAEVWPNGHYIHTIDGHSEQKNGYHFWMLYNLSGPPDASSKPDAAHVHKTGVDSLFPADGGHVLFWYKEL